MITLITPTRNRPEAFALLERRIARQEYHGEIQWIVVNDGTIEYEYHLEQQIVRRNPNESRLHSLCANLLFSIPHIRGDFIVIAEDDDWISSEYIRRLVQSAGTSVPLVGSAPAIYYNLAGPCLRRMSNRSRCSLGQTAFTPAVLPLIENIASRGNPFIDLALWREWKGRRKIIPNDPPIHVSVKSMPGEKGIGNGHSMSGVPDDEHLSLLAALIGEDANLYRPFRQQNRANDQKNAIP